MYLLHENSREFLENLASRELARLGNEEIRWSLIYLSWRRETDEFFLSKTRPE